MTHGTTLTPGEASIIAAAIGALGWSIAGRWQHRSSKTAERVELKLDDLRDALLAHSQDDERRFAEVRAMIPQRKRRLLLPALGLLVRLFM